MGITSKEWLKSTSLPNSKQGERGREPQSATRVAKLTCCKQRHYKDIKIFPGLGIRFAEAPSMFVYHFVSIHLRPCMPPGLMGGAGLRRNTCKVQRRLEPGNTALRIESTHQTHAE